MNNGGYFAVGFALGWSIVSLIFQAIGLIFKLFYAVILLLWEGFTRVSKSLYRSFKNRKSKTNTKE